MYGFYSRLAGIADGGPGNTRQEILLALLCMFEVQRWASAEGLTSREWGLKWGMTLVFQEDAGE